MFEENYVECAHREWPGLGGILDGVLIKGFNNEICLKVRQAHQIWGIQRFTIKLNAWTKLNIPRWTWNALMIWSI